MTTTTPVRKLQNVPNIEQFVRAARYADFKVLPTCLLESAGISDLKGDYPAWVRKCAEKVNRALFPKAYEALETEADRPAYAVGVTFGMMLAGQAKFVEIVSSLPALPEPNEEQMAVLWKWLYGENADKFTRPEDGGIIATEIKKDFTDFEERLSLEQLTELHQGITDASRMVSGDNKATQATKIYAFMAIFWRCVERMETTVQLFDVLTTLYGVNIVGSDPQRIAQLCKRVGKAFRKRGRPRKKVTV